MGKLTLDELDRFTQELTSLTRSSIPLPEGLKQLSTTLEEGRLRGLFREVSESVAKGTPLSEAMRTASLKSPPEFIAVLQCAEQTGDTHAILEFALQHSRRIKKHRSEVFIALVYPAIMVLVLLFAIVLLSNTVMLDMVDIFRSLGAELPFLTQLVLNVSEIFRGPLGLLTTAVLALLIGSYLVVPVVREYCFGILARMPGMSFLIALSDTTLSMRFLGVMLQREVPLPLALQAASLAVTRQDTRDALREMSEAANRGQVVSPYLSPMTPSTASYLFRQGEERGNLPEACLGIADYCEARFDRISRRVSVALEPLLTFFIAIVVAIMVISLYLPLFAIPKIIGR